MRAKEIRQQTKNDRAKTEAPITLTTSTIKRKATIKRSGGGCCMKG
ncbi:hypothetical protein [Gracilibacillus ureilyticus]|nr:hypothetical protein [Gracilibacillus ureilyticus]